jgi:hypothetical protein
MARLNIEESLFSDECFLQLSILLKSEIKAIGYFVQVAMLAQFHWKHGKKLIPKSVYKLKKFPRALIESGMIREMENGYYLHGSAKNFEWIVKKVENGKKGGRPSQVVEKNTKQETEGYDLGKPIGKAMQNPLPLPLPLPLSQSLSQERDYTNININNIISEKIVSLGDDLLNSWNDFCDRNNFGCKKTTNLSGQISRTAIETMRDFDGDERFTGWIDLLKYIENNKYLMASKFLCLAWFVKAETVEKILSRAYDENGLVEFRPIEFSPDAIKRMDEFEKKQKGYS